jgi:EpsI family protein
MLLIKRMNTAYSKIAIFILLNIIFLYKCFPIFFDKWFWTGSYYSHSPLVLAAFIWLLIKRVKSYKPALNNLSINFSGVIITVFSIIIYLIGLWKNFHSFLTWGVFIYIIGNCVLFFGKNFILKNIGIFLYLSLAIPIPEVIINSITFKLNLFASYTSEIFISLLYPSTFRNGNILQVNGHYISITYECSGLSNLLSMFSVIWLLALIQSKKTISVIDYLISIPAAIISNILRIIIVTMFVVNGYEQFALDNWHSEIGIVVFIFIVILIAMFNEFPVKKVGFYFRISLTKLTYFLKENNKFIHFYIILLVIFSIISFIIPSINNLNNSINEILLKDKIPDSIGKWKSRDEIIDESYYNALGTNNLLMRIYQEKYNNLGNDNIYLFIIRSKDNIAAFHRPELCLRGEGYELLTQSEIDIQLKNKRVIPVHSMLFIENNKGLLVYYWYYINGENVKNTIKYQLTFLFNMNKESSGNFIRISKPVNLNNIIQEEQKLKQFAEEAIPEILKYL